MSVIVRLGPWGFGLFFFVFVQATIASERSVAERCRRELQALGSDSESHLLNRVLSLGGELDRSESRPLSEVQVNAARAIKQLMLSGNLRSPSLRHPLREQLWKTLKDCPLDGSQDSMEFCKLIYDSLIFSYARNDVSHPAVFDQIGAAVDRVSPEQSQEDNLSNIKALTLLSDYLVISPIDHEALKNQILQKRAAIDPANQPQVWGLLTEAVEELDRQSSIAIAAGRALSSRGVESSQILLGEGLFQRESSSAYSFRSMGLEEKQKRALELLGLLSTHPRFTRLYMDSFLKMVDQVMPGNPLLARRFLNAVRKDLLQSLSRTDLEPQDRAALSVSERRLMEYWNPTSVRTAN
jgi:hypothetical protein